MILSLTNLTENDLDLFGDGTLILTPNVRTLVFDPEDESTYNHGYVIIRYSIYQVADMIRESVLSAFEDESVDAMTAEEFTSRTVMTEASIFRKTNIQFDNKNGENMFFSLDTNTLFIRNPISGKYYSVALTEVM